MKKFLILSLFVLLMQSCISARVSSHKLVDNSIRYEKLLLLITDSENVFYHWDEENFNAIINGRFNDMDGQNRRRSLSNNLFDRFSRELVKDLYNKGFIAIPTLN
ncbi:hypothetical protein [Shivajiella indica]|uniref:Uncharacterized protein n=1 Tax=Shivajiella indica TaxID=872115 RepID=A0ABW5BCJ1_9BACT